MAKSFFGTLNYTSVNEDWRTEREALAIGPGDTALCVTGSGDRPLDLLVADPDRVVAIDLNPAQNHLLRLKVAALATLPFDEYAAFLGLHEAPAAWRAQVMARLEPELPAETRAFWSEHSRAIRAGVIYQGRWERFYRKAAWVVRVLQPGLTRRLFAFTDLDEQRRFVDAQWDTWFWRLAFDVICSRFVSRYVLGDPGYYDHADASTGDFVRKRMQAVLGRYLAIDNFMVSLVIRGDLGEDPPPYLTEEGAALARARLDRLEILTANLVEHLGSDAANYTCLSLSDVPSFLDESGFEALLEGVAGAAPGARFCIRRFLSRQRWPEQLDGRLVRDRALEERLAHEDRAFSYEFIVGRVESETSTSK